MQVREAPYSFYVGYLTRLKVQVMFLDKLTNVLLSYDQVDSQTYLKYDSLQRSDKEMVSPFRPWEYKYVYQS